MLRRFLRSFLRRALRLATLALCGFVVPIGAPRDFVAEPWSSLRSPTREQFVAANVAGAW